MKLRGGTRKEPMLRVATWNVNSIRTAEAELYDIIDNQELDVLMLQETRTRVFKIRGRKCAINSMKAIPKNNKKGGYLSGGIATVALGGTILKKDIHNTSEYILVSNLLTTCETNESSSNTKKKNQTKRLEYMKLINVYLQPDHKQEITERLMETIHRIGKAEPETIIILGGDFNEKLEEENNKIRKGLLHSNMMINKYRGESYHRTGME